MATKFFNLDTDANLGGSNASDVIVASQKAIKTYVDNISSGSSGNVDFPLFYAMAIDHVLTGDEAVGWALQGSLITNSNYSTAVTKIKELYNASSSVDTTYRDITCKLTSDGRYIADYSQKNAIDTLFSETGIADFYILDSTNNQFILPRSKWYRQYTLDTSTVNQIGEERPSAPYASNNSAYPISSKYLLYYRVSSATSITNAESIDAGEILSEQTALNTLYANLLSRVEVLETAMAKAYLGSD